MLMRHFCAILLYGEWRWLFPPVDRLLWLHSFEWINFGSFLFLKTIFLGEFTFHLICDSRGANSLTNWIFIFVWCRRGEPGEPHDKISSTHHYQNIALNVRKILIFENVNGGKFYRISFGRKKFLSTLFT